MQQVYTDYNAKGVRFVVRQRKLEGDSSEVDAHAKQHNFGFKVYKDMTTCWPIS